MVIGFVWLSELANVTEFVGFLGHRFFFPLFFLVGTPFFEKIEEY